MLHESILTLPKFIKFCRKAHIKPAQALGHLCCLWIRGWQSADALIGDSDDVEIAAEWYGKSGALLEALESTRWIDREGDRWLIHDFWQHAPHHVKQRRDRALAREAAKNVGETDNGEGKMAGKGGRKTPKKSGKRSADGRAANSERRAANSDGQTAENGLPKEIEEEIEEEEDNNTPPTPRNGGREFPPIPESLDVPEFRTAWAEWIAYRAERRPKVTPRSATMAFKQLAEMGVPRAISAINRSISSGYQGIVEPHGAANSKVSQADDGYGYVDDLIRKAPKFSSREIAERLGDPWPPQPQPEKAGAA